MRNTIMIGLVLTAALAAPATADTGVQLDGVFVQAGTQTQVTQVEVGQTVDLVVRVRDISDSPTGPIGGSVDVAWDSTALELVDEVDAKDTTEQDKVDVAALFVAPWSGFYAGILAAPGRLEDITAGQTPPFVQLGGATTDFFELTFRALKAGATTVTVTPSGFGLFGVPELAQTQQGGQAGITVVEAAGPATPQPTPPADPFTPSQGCATTGVMVVSLMMLGLGGLVGGRRRAGHR